MGALIKVNPNLPAHLARLTALAVADPAVLTEMTGGVTSGFPIISYKGKVWRIRKGGEEEMYLDDQGNAKPSINVVLVQANPHPSKIFYDKKYEEGVNEAPRCFSNDGQRPDVSVQAPINPICATCPNNVWGSRLTDSGKKSRACQDARRMAVVFADDLAENGDKAEKFLLRVPPASLNPLKDYAEKQLAPKGLPFFSLVTTIGFNPAEAHPQFTFRPARFVDEAEATAIEELRGSPDIMRILAEAQEFVAAGPAEASGAGSGTAQAARPAATAAPATTPAAAKAAPARQRPATEEEAGADTLGQPAVATPAKPNGKAKPAAAAAPQTAEQALDALFSPSAPPPPPAAAAKPAAKPAVKPAGKPAKAAPPPAAVETEAEEGEEENQGTAQPQAGADFDNLLDSILNG